MSCSDPNCLSCQIARALNGALGAGSASTSQLTPAQQFARTSETIETSLREHESAVLRKDSYVEQLRRLAREDEARGTRKEVLGLDRMIISMAEDEIAFRRAQVLKYRALLAEEIGRRVVATAPKASEVSK